MLAFTDGDVWRPGIGDPTVMGWLTVIAYFSVAVLCLIRALGASQAGRRGEIIFWSGLGALLLLLGVNKQLDLQTLLTLTGRRIAISQGWYEQRRVVQIIFVALVGFVAVGGCFLMWRVVRGHGPDVWVALVGFALLLAFVFIRAASFHHVDTLINLRLGGVRMNWVLELGSLAVIAAGARPRLRPRTPIGNDVGRAGNVVMP